MSNTKVTRGERRMFKLPYLLGWADTFTGKFRDMRPGRGEAGWTVATFTTAAERAAFMRAHPESRMPSWSRIGSEDS